MAEEMITIHKNDRYPLHLGVMRDKRIGWAAKGLLVWLLSYEGDSEINVSMLLRQTDSQAITLEAAIAELVDAGYMVFDEATAAITGDPFSYIVKEIPDDY